MQHEQIFTGSIQVVGAFSLGKDAFPKGLPLKSGTIAGSISETGKLAFKGAVGVKLGPAGEGQLTAAYDGGDLSGQGELGIDPALLSGFEGKMKITHGQGLWAGETTLGFKADDGKLLGGINVSGAITVTDPILMFPEKRVEKELINKSTNIPLWAILVAVLRIRAGIGPGVFRNITVTGSCSIGKEGKPSFSISGEMFIPAFVEGHVGFGAGLGLDVVLGELTGGIEAMGTAGIYGAISVVPELEYKDGDYSISGTATMAAGARLKLSLNAWAEVEALWITVWDHTWELASFTMLIGPDLGLAAKMACTFGKGEAPSLEFNTSDVDTHKLTTDAMPKDGPPSAGVKQETKNAAKWMGAQKAKPPEPPPSPEKPAPAVAAPPGKGQKSGNPPKGKPGEGKTPDPKTAAPKDPAKSEAETKAAAPDPKAHRTVEDGKAASTKTPRHPAQVTLAMLDEPPAPMPRTKEQQEADIDAAAKMVSLVTGKVGDTDRVDDHFNQIQARFLPGSVACQVDPGPELSVKVSVNPDRIVKINAEIKNLPVGAHDAKADNKVAFTMATRSWDVGGGQMVADRVGVKMVASALSPLHPKGSGSSDKR